MHWFSKAFLWELVCLCLMSSYLELELGSSVCLLNKELLSNSHTEAECSRGCHGPPTSKTDKIPQDGVCASRWRRLAAASEEARADTLCTQWLGGVHCLRGWPTPFSLRSRAKYNPESEASDKLGPVWA